MKDKKDFSVLTLEELLKEEKKCKRNDIYSFLLFGLIGVIMMYSVIKKGFSWATIAIPFILLFLVSLYAKLQSEKLKEIKRAIKAKK